MRHRKVQAQGVMPEHIAVGGDSARVILIFAVLQKLRVEAASTRRRSRDFGLV